jgi:O-antigen/teichoic acid export membrane protein
LGAQYYTPSGRRKQSSKYIISGAGLNLVMNLILIPRFGAVGATISTLAAEGLISFLYVKNSSGYVSFQKLYHKGIKKFFAGLLMFLVIILVDRLIKQSTISLVVQIITGGLVYFLALLLLRDRGMQVVKQRFIKK